MDSFILPQQRVEEDSHSSDQPPAFTFGPSLHADIASIESDEIVSEEADGTHNETLSGMLTSMSQWIRSGVKVKATSLMLDALGIYS
jgi:hypothetical protein